MSRAAVALLLLLLFYAIAFGLRTWQHLRATGSTGFAGISGRPGSAEWLGGALFVVGVLLSVVAALFEALGWVAPLWLPSTVTAGLGVLLTLVGIASTYAAQVSMGTSWRIGVDAGERTQLVTEGAFAVVRNPIFACMLISGFGLILLLPNALSLAAVVTLTAAIQIQVRAVEEPHLLRVHGQRYRDYARQVGRFLPGLGRLSEEVAADRR
jgi:protein-S-isoprenylcysteine O-methyltransferase Ste14